MAKKLFTVLLALMILTGSAFMHAPARLAAQSDDAEKTTIGEITTLMFYNLYPRMTGEDEFYLVTDKEDIGRAQAVAEAINNARITRATALSGNLVRVTVPRQYKGYAIFIASNINGLEVTLPKSDPDDEVPTKVLMGLLRKDPDDLVRLNAAISLGRRKEMDAYAALSQIAAEEKGWVRRGAMHAMSMFQSVNAKQMQKWRMEFLNAVNRVLRMLQSKPQGDEALKKQTEELKAAFGDVLAYYRLFESNPAAEEEMRESLKILRELIADAAAFYPDKEKVEVEKLVDAAAKGIAEYLDQFTSYWDADTYSKFQQHTQGKFVGIGVFIDKDDQGFKIVSPIFGSPAYKAGLKARDRIVTVNGEEIKNLDMDMIREKIIGEAGTVVKIGVMRRGWAEPRIFDIKRGVIKLPTVLYSMLPGGVGYIKLLQFNDEAPVQLQKALDDLNKQGMKGLVIDLRNNPGGLVGATLKIASMFLPKKVVITTLKGRKENPSSNKILYADSVTKRQDNYPIVILVNGASASGSELLTGSMRDHKRAIILGQTTYGKGCGQKMYPILTSNGERFLKITVFKYYLPGGTCIHEIGVKPDIPLPAEELDHEVVEEIGKITPEILEKYIQKYFEGNRDIFEKLSKNDDYDAKRYPGFEEFYKSLETPLDEDTVRRVLRSRIRTEISNQTSKMFACDLQEDKEIQRGIFELLRKMGLEPVDVEGFQNYGKRIEKELEAVEEKQPEDAAAEDEKAGK